MVYLIHMLFLLFKTAGVAVDEIRNFLKEGNGRKGGDDCKVSLEEKMK